MSRPQDREAVKDLLDGLTFAEVREFSVNALRTWHRRGGHDDHISMHGVLGVALLPILLEYKHRTADFETRNHWKEPFIDTQSVPWMAPVLDFIWWFIRAGFAVPLEFHQQNIITMLLTPRGRAFLDTTDEHPLVPGFVDRVRQRCANLPDDVTALLLDARECFEYVLLRPAIVLMGVAYEAAIEAVIVDLVGKARLAATVQDQNAARRISSIRAVVDAVLPGGTPQERDDRFAAHRAYNFADDLRRRRNDASHTTPRYGFDRAETEELLVSAGRNLPALWSLTR